MLCWLRKFGIDFYSFCFCFSEGTLLLSEEASRFEWQNVKNKKQASVERSLRADKIAGRADKSL